MEADSLGNIISSAATADALLASVEYAVMTEQAERIIVCGHTKCKMLDLIRAQPDFRIVATRRVGVPVQSLPEVQEIAALIESNVLLQLKHLRSLDSLMERLVNGSLSLHGRVVYEELRYVAEFDPSSNAFLIKHTYTDDYSCHVN